MSKTELSKRLGELAQPRPMSLDVLRKLEDGTRAADVDDLVALAVVFGVHPTALLLPFTSAGDVLLSGAGEVPARDAWKWAEGRRPLVVPDDDDGRAQVDFQTYARPHGIRSYHFTEPGAEHMRRDLDELGFPPPMTEQEVRERFGVVRIESEDDDARR